MSREVECLGPRHTGQAGLLGVRPGGWAAALGAQGSLEPSSEGEASGVIT